MFSSTNPMHLAKRVVAYLFTLLVMVSIFSFSAQPAKVSNNTSKTLSKKIVSAITKNKKVSSEKKNEMIKKCNDIIRKIAHFSLFLLLGASSFASASLTFIKKGKHYMQKNAAYALVFCVLYAIIDEIHQLYVPGRSGQISDVFIDSTGSLAGIVAACFIFYLIQRKKAVA